MATIHAFPSKDKRPYLITFDRGQRAHQRVYKLAHSWWDAWSWAVAQGRVVSGVVPQK
jgi:hypothetical protein